MNVPILTYHSLDESRSSVAVSPAQFRRHVELLSAAGWVGLPLREALTQPPSARARILAVTFDDGYRNVLRHAPDVLASRGWRATIFPIADYIGRDNRWPGQHPSLPWAPLLDWDGLQELARAGWEIGSHGKTHADLTARRDLEAEIFGAKVILEDHLGQPVLSFAYPYGRHNVRVRSAVSAHYALACTTRMGIARRSDDLCSLSRVDMRYFITEAACRLLASPLLEPYTLLCHAWRSRFAFVPQSRPVGPVASDLKGQKA